MRNWSATSNLLSLLCHFLPSTRHFSHVLIEAYRPGTFTAWVMDGNFSGYWIAILVFISSFPRTDRLLASVQMSFLSYRYPTSPAPSYKSGIDYCCSFWVSILFRWTEMYSKLHFSLAPTMFCIKLRKQVQKSQSTPPSRCKYKYPVIPLAQTPETNSDLRFSIASYIKSTATYFLHLSGFQLLHTPKYFLSGLTNLKRSHYNLFRRVWLTACQLGLTDGCWIVVSRWVSWIFHLHKKCRHWGREMQCTSRYSRVKAMVLNIQI